MAYKQESIKFHGDEIKFLINNNSALIMAKSIVNGMQLDWPSQTRKIQRYCCQNAIIKTVRGKRSAIHIPHKNIRGYLDSINLSKAQNKERVELYQREFLPWSYDNILPRDLLEIENEYTESLEGIFRLIYDSIIVLGNPNAITQIAGVLDDLLNSDLIGEKPPVFEKENCTKTRNAYNAMLDNIGFKIADVSDPIQDLVSTTAMKHKEIERIKSKSIQARIQKVAERIYDTDRNAALELKRIAKGVNI